MEVRVLCFCVFFIITSRSQGQSTQTLVIDKLWNGTDLAAGSNVTLSLTGTANTKDITLQIRAPFFNDPAPSGPPGQSFNGLWKYEVVEAFFINNFNQYLEIEISPHGQHLVMLLNGSRNYIRQFLPLEVSTSIEGDFWTGTVLIPGDYFPPQVTKFNAHAMHRTGDMRQFWSLYPSDSAITEPNFHALQFSNFIDYATISPSLESNPVSALWENALKRAIKYTIDKTWNGQHIEGEIPVTLIITSSSDSSDLIVNITAPYFGDPSPTGTPGKPFLGLWNYEVVELFFLNDLNQYLELEIGPFGHHITLLLAGVRNTIRHSLPLNVSTASGRHIWQGTAVIPGDYLPANVVRFNAYAIHGPAAQRVYWSLYPTDGSTESPDFHNLQFFRAIDLHSIFPDNTRNELSPLWDAALQGIIRFDITSQWNGLPSTVGDALVTLQGFQGGVEVNFTVSNNVKFMPLKYATFIFKNVNGESVKVIVLPTESHSIFLSNATNVLLQESSTMDFRVTANDDFMKGSVLMPPEYFPPNVTLLNLYFTFGISVVEVISLEPSVVTDTHVDVISNLEESVHFVQIDFETVIETNLLYSSKWQALVLTTTSTEFENTTESTLSEALSIKTSPKEIGLSPSINDVKRKNENPEELKKIMDEGVKKLLAEIQADTLVSIMGQKESQIDDIASVTKVDEKIVDRNEYQEALKVVITKNTDAGSKNNEGQKEVKVSIAELKKVEGQAEKVTAAEVNKDEVQEEKVTAAEVNKDEVQEAKVTAAEVKEDKGQALKETYVKVKKDEGQEVKATAAEVNKDKVQVAKVTATEIKEDEGQALKETDFKVKKDEGQEATITAAEVKEDESQALKETDAKVKKDEGKEVKDAGALALNNERQEVMGTGAADKKDEEQEEIKVTDVEIKKAEGSETQDKVEQGEVKGAGAEVKKDEGRTEAKIIGAEVKKDESLKKIRVETTDIKDKIKDEILDEVIIEDAAVADDGLNKKYETTIKDEEVQHTFPSNREEAQRRIEGEESDRNVLQIPFKISFVSQEKNEDSSDHDIGLSTSPQPSTTNPKSDIEGTVDRLVDILNPGSQEKNEKSSDHDIGISSSPQSSTTNPNSDIEGTVDRLVNILNSRAPEKNEESSDHDIGLSSSPQSSTTNPKSDIEDAVDRLIDILNSGPPETNIGDGLLPPPHPICFTPGLVADNFRCQVFYECVMENGRWEVYNWRCKRGYFYDAEKVACIRGYC